MTVEIVILAMIAAFLGLRLYSVLGRRADHGDEPVHTRFDAKSGNNGGQNAGGTSSGQSSNSVAPIVPITAPVRTGERPAAGVKRDAIPVAPAIERALRDISTADRQFEAGAFLDGARAAYRMILEAFWRGDKAELSQMCEPAVAASFIAEIDARDAAGEKLDHRLVRIEELTIVDAAMTGAGSHAVARIGVRFVADIAAVTRNAEGTVIAGSLDDAVEVRDVWTFTRELNSAHPDWLLDETDEG